MTIIIKNLLLGLLILSANSKIAIAQEVDLTSVDEFFKVTSTLKGGKEISAEQWKDFNSSGGYRTFAEREDKSRINLIKSLINIAFGDSSNTKKDSILSIPEKGLSDNIALWVKKHTLINYLDMKDNFESITLFRDNYDFNALIDKSKQRLFSFLGEPIDTAFRFKTVYFHCREADGINATDGIYVDFNFIYKKTEEQRENFLAHEFFHNYREKYENHDFNYKKDLNHCIDFIQNEGIADLIDKSDGYQKYFSDDGELPDMVETWVSAYNQAQADLERLQNVIMKFSKDEISENELVDEILKIVKFNGHPIGFFMANQIVSAGYKNELLKTFYNPYEFFYLYNKAAKEQSIFQLSDEFMNYLKDLTKDYYH
jgi:hypothetical protein